MNQFLLDLKLIALYNIGVENEHLFHKEKSVQYYNEALQLAKEIADH